MTKGARYTTEFKAKAVRLSTESRVFVFNKELMI